MRRSNAVFVAATALLAAMTGMNWRWASSLVRKSPPAVVQKSSLTALVTQPPLTFELNQGQFDPRVLYAAHTSGGTLFFTNDGLTLALPRFAPRPPRFQDPRERFRKHPALESVTALRLAFDGANPAAQVEATDQQPGIKNYLIGRDPENWHTHVPIFGKVAYRNLYPGIDLVFYGGKSGQLEYDLNVLPGADPGRVRFRFEGADRVELDEGDLLIHARSAELRQPRPHVYASASIPGRELPVSYRIGAGGWIGLNVSKRDVPDGLRIDPVLAYSTYLGGSGAGDFVNSMALDEEGCVYVAGNVTSIDFPTTDGSFQPHDPKSGTPVANLGISTVTKLDPTGASLIYSTYIGSELPDGGDGDEADAIVVTDAGVAYVAGQTCAPDFPVTDGGAQTTFGGGAADGYVLELAPEGDRLIYSTFLGGPDDEILGCVDLDSDGNAYVGGVAFGTPVGDGTTYVQHFPTENALQPSYGGGPYDGIFAKLSPDGAQFSYKSYFGGSGSGVYSDQLDNIRVDTLGRPTLLGQTPSDDVPGHGMSPRPFHGGVGGDVYLTKLESDGRTPIFFTYLGGSGVEWGWDLKLDPLGNSWIVGQTSSGDFPVMGHAFQTSLANPSNLEPSGGFDAFIAVVDPTGALVYATYLGGSGDDRALGIALDTQGHAHVMGITTSTDLMTVDALRDEHAQSLGFDHAQGGGDMFLADLTIDGGLDSLSYVGGSGTEFVWDFTGMIGVDSLGATYFIGNSASDDFPVTDHAFQRRNNAPADATNMVVVKIMPTPPPCTLTSLQTNSGPYTGISDLKVAGTNMSAQSELDFGGVPSIIEVASPDGLQVNVEPHACGAVDVTLLCPGSPISVLPQGFTFTGCDGGGDEHSSDGGPLPVPAYGCGCGSTSAPLAAFWILGASLLAMARRWRQRRDP